MTGKNEKVRITIPGTYIAADLPKEKAQIVFWKLAKTLEIFIRTDSAIPDLENDMVEDSDSEIPMPKAQTHIPEELYLPDSAEEEIESMELSVPEPTGLKFKGFLYVKCPKCGKVKGFMAKKPIDHYHCDSCGTRSEFDGPLVPLWVNCECGKTFHYFTNMKEPAFDIKCLECGAPVAIEWNNKKHMYVTMRER